MAKRDTASGQRLARDKSPYANTSDVSDSDQPLLHTPGGREEGLAPDEPLSDFEAEVRSHPVGGQPMSEITGKHDPGTGDETVDGLDPTEEAVRRSAEDRPVGGRRERG